MKLLSLLTGLLIAGTANAGTIQINASGDAMVNSLARTQNYGSDARLVVNSSDSVNRSFLKFQVSGVSSVTSAKLRLHVVEGSANGPKLVRAGSSWDEMKISFSQQPSFNTTTLEDKASLASGSIVEYDVTKLIQRVGNSTYGFALLPTSTDSTTFGSKESANPPQLIIEMGGTTSTPTPTPIPTTPTPIPTTPTPTPVTSGSGARPADSVVDSIGLVAHLNWGGTVWDTGFPKYEPLFGELGVRYIRTQASSGAKSKIDTLYSKYGTRFTFTMMTKDANDRLDASQLSSKLNYIRDSIGVNKVIAIEGPNEYNDRRDWLPNWDEDVRNYQAQLYAKVKGDAALKVLPVVGPSIWYRIHEDFVKIGNIDQSVDIPNLHYYTFGRKPTLFREKDGNVSLPMDEAINWAKILAPSAPCVWVTETGYDGSTNERVAAKYMLRMYLEFYNRCGNMSGKVFQYNLLDDTKAFGMLRADFSRRPVFYAVKNLIKLLSDKGAAFTPSPLAHSLAGDMTNIHKTVLQKRDGKFYLAIWQDVDSETSTRGEAIVPVRNLTLDVSKHNFSKMNVYFPSGVGMSDPNNGSLPSQSVTSPSVVNINVPDQVMILELIP
jgi:hypothetical protein